MPYPRIMNGDHAEFEAEWAASGRPVAEKTPVAPAARSRERRDGFIRFPFLSKQ